MRRDLGALDPVASSPSLAVGPPSRRKAAPHALTEPLVDCADCLGLAEISSAGRSGEHFGELDQVAEGVAEEGQLPADGGEDEGLGDDLDAAAAKLGERLLDAPDVEAEVVVAAVLQAVAEVRVRPHLGGQLVP